MFDCSEFKEKDADGFSAFLCDRNLKPETVECYAKNYLPRVLELLNAPDARRLVQTDEAMNKALAGLDGYCGKGYARKTIGNYKSALYAFYFYLRGVRYQKHSRTREKSQCLDGSADMSWKIREQLNDIELRLYASGDAFWRMIFSVGALSVTIACSVAPVISNGNDGECGFRSCAFMLGLVGLIALVPVLLRHRRQLKEIQEQGIRLSAGDPIESVIVPRECTALERAGEVVSIACIGISLLVAAIILFR